MIIYISGKSPNTSLTLQAETQAERDQIARLRKEGAACSVETAGCSYDPADTLRIRLENKTPMKVFTGS